MDQITLSNFRCFGKQQTARLAPLTLLVGENSTGKTSFLALIRALWGMAYRQRKPDFKEEPYDLGSFDDIAHHRGRRGSRGEMYKAGFSRIETHDKEIEGAESKFLFKFTFTQYRTRAAFEIRLEYDESWVEIHLLGNETMEVRARTPNGEWKRSLSERLADFVEGDGDRFWAPPFLLFWSRVEDSEANWVSLKGPGLPSDKDLEEIFTLLGMVSGYSDRPRQILPYASAPVRSKPRRTYDPADRERDPEGDNVPMYFARISIRSAEEWTALRRALEVFGKEAGLFDEISVRRLGKKESEPFQIQVRKFGSASKGPPRNLVDVGYGVSQILPVIAELLRNDTAPLYLLQQPEIHLHPSAQAALGTLLCRIAGPSCQLIVETHSDHLLDRVRMDVRDGTTQLKPEDVSILYFDRGDLDVRIHSLRIDEEGNILGAPDGYRRFFMEETSRSIGL